MSGEPVTDLAEFLRFMHARLDEDEQYARNAFGDHNDAGPDWLEIWSGGLQVGSDVIDTNDSQVSRFMERHDPARVLREVEAKRRVIDEHQPERSYVYRDDGTPACGTCGDGTVEWPCLTLRLLALPYADHEEFDDAWRV